MAPADEVHPMLGRLAERVRELLAENHRLREENAAIRSHDDWIHEQNTQIRQANDELGEANAALERSNAQFQRLNEALQAVLRIGGIEVFAEEVPTEDSGEESPHSAPAA